VIEISAFVFVVDELDRLFAFLNFIKDEGDFFGVVELVEFEQLLELGRPVGEVLVDGAGVVKLHLVDVHVFDDDVGCVVRNAQLLKHHPARELLDLLVERLLGLEGVNLSGFAAVVDQEHLDEPEERCVHAQRVNDVVVDVVASAHGQHHALLQLEYQVLDQCFVEVLAADDPEHLPVLEHHLQTGDQADLAGPLDLRLVVQLEADALLDVEPKQLPVGLLQQVQVQTDQVAHLDIKQLEVGVLLQFAGLQLLTLLDQVRQLLTEEDRQGLVVAVRETGEVRGVGQFPLWERLTRCSAALVVVIVAAAARTGTLIIITVCVSASVSVAA